MEKNSGVLANTLKRILRYKGSTLYRALTVYLKMIEFYKKIKKKFAAFYWVLTTY